MAALQEILKDTADYVSWQLEEGETTVEVSRAVLDELATPTQPPTGNQTVSAASTDRARTPKDVVVTHTDHATPTGICDSSALHAAKDTPDPLSGDAQTTALTTIAHTISACTRCPLHSDRTNAVPGQGSATPDILFVGEAPGADEDQQGLAFVGRAGKLLTKMIEAMGYTREDVFIANVNKCRPPNNRKPAREEMDACLPYLRQQVALLKPKVIVALGATAVEGLVPESASQKISHLRGKWLAFEGIPLMPTYHPAYLLRSPAMKKPVWMDLQEVLRKIGKPIPKRESAS